jgi:hypothetical protein
MDVSRQFRLRYGYNSVFPKLMILHKARNCFPCISLNSRHVKKRFIRLHRTFQSYDFSKKQYKIKISKGNKCLFPVCTLSRRLWKRLACRPNPRAFVCPQYSFRCSLRRSGTVVTSSCASCDLAKLYHESANTAINLVHCPNSVCIALSPPPPPLWILLLLSLQWPPTNFVVLHWGTVSTCISCWLWCSYLHTQIFCSKTNYTTDIKVHWEMTSPYISLNIHRIEKLSK